MIEFVREKSEDSIKDTAIIYGFEYIRFDMKDERRTHKNKILNTDNKFFKIINPDNAIEHNHIICPCGGEKFNLIYSLHGGLKGKCVQCGIEDIVHES